MKRAVTIIAKGIIVLLVFAALLCAGMLGYARAQGLMMLSVQTGSMRPVIQPGDAVLLRQGSGKVTIGSVISYRSLQNPRMTITHRVVSIDRSTGQIYTKGDALLINDPPFGADRIIGTVEKIVPAAGYSLDFMRRPAGLIAMVYVPAVVLAYGEVRRLMSYYDQRRYRLYAYMW